MRVLEILGPSLAKIKIRAAKEKCAGNTQYCRAHFNAGCVDFGESDDVESIFSTLLYLEDEQKRDDDTKEKVSPLMKSQLSSSTMPRLQSTPLTPTVVEFLLNMRSAQDVERSIKATCLAGLAVGVIQVVSALWQVSGTGASGSTLFALATALLMFGSLIGVMRFSRMSAAALLVVYLATQVRLWVFEPGGGNVVMGLFSILFIFLFVRGLQATFVYHKLAKTHANWERTMDSLLDPRLFEDEEEE
jgi:hypothetical protein